jgi:hypothetical protein
MKQSTSSWLLAVVLLSIVLPAAAWSNHALGTWQALSVVPEIQNAPSVAVESLGTFVSAEGRGLEQLLRQEEQWARTHVAFYPPRPDALAFHPGSSPAQQRQRFLGALRINPDAKLSLFLQTKPGAELNGQSALPWTEVTTLRRETSARRNIFLRLREGDRVALSDVVASASDEPDYGLDIGLWEDSGTLYGKRYGFGKLPFGNPALEFSSQAPFHMGFFHESAIVYKAAGFLQRTYPEYRIHLYRSLASYALRTGHPYWGWRFAGWALHYVQDLTQPYHATVLPGVSVPRMLWINTLDLLKFHAPKVRIIRLVSNRHLALENYQNCRMRAAYERHDMNDALLRAVRDTAADGNYPPYADDAARQVISSQAHAAADAADRTLERRLPAKFVSDPAYVVGETEVGLDLFVLVKTLPPTAQDDMTNLVAGLMRHFGEHSRSLVRSLLVAARS